MCSTIFCGFNTFLKISNLLTANRCILGFQGLNFTLNSLTSNPSIWLVPAYPSKSGSYSSSSRNLSRCSSQVGPCSHLSHRIWFLSFRGLTPIYHYIFIVYLLSFSVQVCKVHNDREHLCFIHLYPPSTSLEQSESQQVCVEGLQFHVTSCQMT